MHWAKIKPQVDDLLRWHGIKLFPDSASYRALSRSLLAKFIGTWETQRQRFAGEPIPTPAAVPLVLPNAATSTKGDTLVALLEYWKMRRNQKARSVGEATFAVKPAAKPSCSWSQCGDPDKQRQIRNIFPEPTPLPTAPLYDDLTDTNADME